MQNKLIKPLAALFLDPLINHSIELGLNTHLVVEDLWDGRSKWIEADNWAIAAARLEELTRDPLACYKAGFKWAQDILQYNSSVYDTKVVIGRTYTLEKEYVGNGVLRLTMHHAPNMEPPRSGILFNLGGLNGIAKNQNPYGKAILIESHCSELPPLPNWHPEVSIGDSDIFELT